MMKRLTNLLVFSLVLIASAGKTQPGINTFPLLGTTPDAADLFIMVDDTDTSTKNVTFGDMSAHAPAAHNHVELDITDLGAYLETVLASDINAEASADGYVLTSDGAGNAAWEAASGGGALNDLTDVTITTPSSNQVLSYNGSAWVNATASGGGGSGVVAPKVLIEEITLSTAGEFDFTVGSAADYTRLILEVEIRSPDASQTWGDDIYLFFNGNTTLTNYFSQTFYAVNNTVQGVEVANEPRIGNATYTGSNASETAVYTVVIDNPGGSNKKKAQSTGIVRYASGSAYSGSWGMFSEITDAITQIQIQSQSHPTDGLTGVARLYGERSITVEDSETITVKKAVPVTLTGGEFDIDLTDYQDGDAVVIEGRVRSSVAATIDEIRLFFNGDTNNANYRTQRHYANNGTGANTTASTAHIMLAPAASSPAGSYVDFVIRVPNYTSATDRLQAVSEYTYYRDNDQQGRGGDGISWDTAGPITSIKLRTDGGEDLSGTLKAYIEKEGVLPVAQGPHVIETITLSTAGEFDFDNIPGGYRRLIVKGVITAGSAVDNQSVLLNVNGQTAGYHYQVYGANNGSQLVGEGTSAQIVQVAAGSSNIERSPVSVAIEGYTDTAATKVAEGRFVNMTAAGSIRTADNMLITPVTGAITRLQFLSSDSPTTELTGTLTLYGEY